MYNCELIYNINRKNTIHFIEKQAILLTLIGKEEVRVTVGNVKEEPKFLEQLSVALFDVFSCTRGSALIRLTYKNMTVIFFLKKLQ